MAPRCLICFIACLVPLAKGMIATTTLKYQMRWSRCSDAKPFRTLMNVSIKKCVSECDRRGGCGAVNYWRRRAKCQLLPASSLVNVPEVNRNQTCVFISKEDFHQTQKCPISGPSCSDKAVCHADSSNCTIEECRKLELDNGFVLGNMVSVESKVKVGCHQQYRLAPPQQQMECQINELWSGQPKCVEKCGTGWHQIGKSCYFVEETKMDVYSAVDFCKAKESYLVQLETEMENDEVKAFVTERLAGKVDTVMFWLGITDEDTEGTWLYMESKRLASFLIWNLGEPNGFTSENHAVLFPPHWVDISGEWADGAVAVCEKSADVIV